jgi:hypothetical protein
VDSNEQPGGDGGNTGDGGTDAGETAREPSEDTAAKLKERLQQYLAKHKKPAAPLDLAPGQNSNSNTGTDNVYCAVRTIRLKMLKAPGLFGGVFSISGAVENARPDGGTWGSPYYEKKDFGRKRILSLSFDPSTFKCSCKNSHAAFDSAGGGMEGGPLAK